MSITSDTDPFTTTLIGIAIIVFLIIVAIIVGSAYGDYLRRRDFEKRWPNGITAADIVNTLGGTNPSCLEEEEWERYDAELARNITESIMRALDERDAARRGKRQPKKEPPHEP